VTSHYPDVRVTVQIRKTIEFRCYCVLPPPNLTNIIIGHSVHILTGYNVTDCFRSAAYRSCSLKIRKFKIRLSPSYDNLSTGCLQIPKGESKRNKHLMHVYAYFVSLTLKSGVKSITQKYLYLRHLKDIDVRCDAFGSGAEGECRGNDAT